MDPKFKIAYWLTDKKKSKLKIDQIEQLLRKDGYQLIRIVKPEDFETKGPFSLFFHKLTDITINQNNNAISSSTNKLVDLETENWIQKYRDYINKFPWTRILDPLSKIENLLNRNRQYQLVVLRNKEKGDQSYFIPNFIELKTKNREENIRLLRENDVKFPIVCKPLIAHGCTLAHQMSLVFSDAGLDDIRPPCVAQSFIKHSCKLYKLFVLKNQYFIVERPSLKNFEAGHYPTVHFDSHQISKMDSACELNEMSKDCELRLKNRELNKEILDKIVDCMREVFDLTFFGVDVIIDDETDRYVIIDINNFPAYDGISDFARRFKDVLIEESKIAMYLYKNSLTDSTDTNNCNHNLPTTHTHQVVANTIYSRIRQWFLTLNKKVN